MRGSAAILLLLLTSTHVGSLRAEAPCPVHWIVSTHGCDQRTDGWCSRSCPRVYRRGCSDRLTEVRLESFVAALPPGRPVVVFVHGSFLKWDSTLVRARETFAWLERHRGDGPPPVYVGFAWPSDPVTLVVPSIDVNVLGRRASLNGYYLARFLNALPANTKITLVGHSHGTRVAAGALHVIGGGRLWDHGIPRQNLQPRRIRTVFAAAAMDRHWMYRGERYDHAWYAVDGLVHLRNPKDAALDIYPLRRPFAKRALGQVGFEGRCLVPYGNHARGLVEVDVSSLVGGRHTWNHYTDRPEIGRYLAPYVFHEVPVAVRAE